MDLTTSIQNIFTVSVFLLLLVAGIVSSEFSGNASIKSCTFRSRISYDKLVILQEPIETDSGCTYFNDSGYDNETFIGDGRVYNIIFTNPSNLSFSVGDTYDDQNHTISIYLNSTWSAFSGATNASYLMHLFNDSEYRVVNFRTPKRQFRTENCSTNMDRFPVDEKWCRRHVTFKEYTGLNATMDASLCEVYLRDMQAHYLYLWEKSSSHVGRYKTCFDSYHRKYPYSAFLASKYLQDEFPQFFTCYYGKTQSEIDGNCNLYNLKQYSAIAEGLVSQFHIQRRGNDFDVQIHIDLHSWTSDYPKEFFKSVNACLSELGTSSIPAMLQVIILHPHELPPPKPDEPPIYFWLFVFLMISPGFVLIIAIIILVFTCSSRGLQIDVWKWPQTKKRLTINNMLYENDEYLALRKKSSTVTYLDDEEKDMEGARDSEVYIADW